MPCNEVKRLIAVIARYAFQFPGAKPLDTLYRGSYKTRNEGNGNEEMEMEKWRNGEMGKWRNGEMEKWRNGEMEKWRNGEMEKWRNGEMEKWEK